MHADEILHRFLRDECPWMHAKRRQCLTRVTMAAQRGGLGVVKMAKHLQSSTALRYDIKCVDRLLSNSNLAAERREVYGSLARRVIGSRSRIGILIDWSELRDDGSSQLLRATTTVKGRAFTIYEEVHPQNRLGALNVHKQFLKNLKAVLPNHCDPIIITDAGFRGTFFKAVSQQGWSWIGRIRNVDTVCPIKRQAWAGCKTLYAKAKTKALDLGNFLYTKAQELQCRLIVIKAKAKKRHKHTAFGKPSQSSHSKKCRAAQVEPWLLAVSPCASALSAQEVVQLYAGRMQIEQTFRDLKNPNFGMGLRTSQTRCARRLAALLLIAVLLTYVLWIVGLTMRAVDADIAYGSRRKRESTLSVLSLAAYWLNRCTLLWIAVGQLDDAIAELTNLIPDYEK